MAVTNVEKQLKSHVLDNIEYSKGQIRVAYLGLIFGLWVVFFTCVALLFCMTHNYLGPTLETMDMDALQPFLNK